MLPLVCLDEVLELCPRRTRFDPTEITYIVVLQVDGRTFGLVVDSVTDTQEIVVKPLGRFIAGLGTYSGSTIMGDGSLALILDVAGIAQKNSILSERRNQSFAGISKRAETASAKAQDSLLIVDDGDGSCVAMKLSTVARLVEFDVSQIERTRHADVLKYRDRIVPIVWFNGHDLRRSIEADKQRISVVLFESGPCLIGLVVARVIDIVQRSQVDRDTDTLPGHFVVQGRVAQLVDIEEYLRTACPGAFELSSQSAADSMATLQLV